MTIRTRAGPTWRIEGPARKSRPDKALIAGLHRAYGALNDRAFDLVNIKTPLNNARGVVDPYLRKLTALRFLLLTSSARSSRAGRPLISD